MKDLVLIDNELDDLPDTLSCITTFHTLHVCFSVLYLNF